MTVGTSEMIIPGGESKGVVNLLDLEHTFGQRDNNSSPIPVDWCILDNQSTVNVIHRHTDPFSLCVTTNPLSFSL